jgi:hypothetical protein
MDKSVVTRKVVFGQQPDLERGLGHAGKSWVVWGPRFLVKVPPESVRNVLVREPLFCNLEVAIQQPTCFRLKLHEDPTVEGGPFGRLLISHGESLMEVAKTPRRAYRVHFGGVLVAHTSIQGYGLLI